MANVLYDFNPDEPNGLKVCAGESVVIIDKEIGSGWCKERNMNGFEGFIPSNFAEISSISEARSIPQTLNEHTVMISPPEKDDNDWDNSDTEHYKTYLELPKKHIDTNPSDALRYSVTSKFGNIKMPKSFIKTGGEDFILGLRKTNGEMEATIEIILNDGVKVCQWKSRSMLSCSIVSHEKATKFNGMKQFIVYNLKSSYNDQIISRRYKQFDWLYNVLSDKYPCIVIPPLPNKQVIGRFKDTFLECRQRRLQRWLTNIAKHPILSTCSVVKHFLTVNDKNNKHEKARWTHGKRNAENDPFRGAKFFSVIHSPCDDVDWDEYSKRMGLVSNFIESVVKNTEVLQEAFIIFNKRQSDHISKEFLNFGSAINNVAKSITFSPNNNINDISLIHGMQRCGDAYDKIGKLFFEQPQIDNELLDDTLEEINGCMKELSPLIDLAQCAVSTVQYAHLRTSVTKLNIETAETVDKNVCIITRSIDAELNWLQNEREHRVRLTMKEYLTNQLKMYNQIATIISDALSLL